MEVQRQSKQEYMARVQRRYLKASKREQALAETCPAYGPATLRRQLAAAVEDLERLQERPNELFALEYDENERKKAG